MRKIKKYIKMISCILGILLIISLFSIMNEEMFTSFADTTTKEATVSNVTYLFEAEDIDAKTGYARNVRVKERTKDSVKLTFPDTITVDNIAYKVTSIGKEGESALGGITDWTEVVISKNATMINAGAFKDLATLKTLSFKSGSKEALIIGKEAFSGCTSLVNIRDASTNYTCNVSGCTPISLTEHAAECANKEAGITDRRYKLPSRVGIIDSYAFYNCSAIEKLNINNGVTAIEDYAFNNCTALATLTLGTGLNTLKENTFKGTTPLTTLTIKSNIENHNNAFKGHTGLETLKFSGKECTTIYESMFEGCTGLKSVAQKTSVTSNGSTTKKSYITTIGARAFFGCTELGGHGVKTVKEDGTKETHIVHHIDYSLNAELTVGQDAYRFGGYAEGVTDKPTINITQGVSKADTDYYTNGIGKVTMDISSTDKEKINPKDYIICIDTTGSMDTKTKVERPKKDKDGNDVLDKNGNVVMVKCSKMEIAVESLKLLANKIYQENPENRLAIVTQKGHSYLFMDFMDGSNIDKVNELIGGMTTSSKGNEEYGNKKAYYLSTEENGSIGTNYRTGLLTMADVISERQIGKDRNVYGIFISDGFPNRQNTQIKGAAAQLQGYCDAIWSVGIAMAIDDGDPSDGEEVEPGDDSDEEFEEEEIDKTDIARFLKYIRTYWGHDPLFYNFPDDGDLEKDFQAFMESIVEVSTSSLKNVNFKSKLDTSIWEFYTGTDYTNSEGVEIEEGQYATIKIPKVGKENQEYSYYIRLKDNNRGITEPNLLVSDDLSATYTVTGGRYNGWVFDQEKGWEFDKENQDEEYIKKYSKRGVKAIYDEPLHLDWVVEGKPPVPSEQLYPGVLEILKTGEGIVNVENKPDGTISPIFGEVKVKGAEFGIYAKEDIYIIDNTTNPDNTENPTTPGTKLLYGKDTLINTIVTDEYGKAQIEDLPAGKYYVKEQKAGEGYTLNQEIKEFEILDKGQDKTIQKIEVNYKNERQKVNINGKEGLIIEKTAEKKVYKPGEEIKYTIKVTNTTKNSIKEIYVGEAMIEGRFEDISTDNIIKISDKLIGIKELKPGESVELKFITNITSPAEKEKIKNQVKAVGKIQEPDPEDPNKIIEKEIIGEDEEEIYIAAKELLIIKEALKQEYYPGETIQYIIKVINNSKTEITDAVIEENMLEGKFVNIEELNKNGVDVKIVNDQKVTISKIAPGKTITLKYEYTISKDTKVEVNEENKMILGNRVTIKAKTIDPEGNTPIEIEDEDIEEIEIDVQGSGSGLGIIKKDIETGKTIKGAVIGLYAKEDIKGNDGNILIAKNTLIEKSTTDEQGKAKYTVDLPLGKYYIKEIEAPTGYKLSEEEVEVIATYRGQEIDKIDISAILTNKKAGVDFAIEKTLSSISMNGENVEITDEKLTKLEINSSKMKNADIVVRYNIEVKNKSDIQGTAKVLEIVPQGYEVVEAPEYWTIREDGILETEVNLEGKQSRNLSIALKWINKEENLGSRSNTAKLELDDDSNTDINDDNSQATVIINVKTGEKVSAIIIIMIIVSLGICGYIIANILSKMGKGPNIKGIKFMKRY